MDRRSAMHEFIAGNALEGFYASCLAAKVADDVERADLLVRPLVQAYHTYL